MVIVVVIGPTALLAGETKWIIMDYTVTNIHGVHVVAAGTPILIQSGTEPLARHAARSHHHDSVGKSSWHQGTG